MSRGGQATDKPKETRTRRTGASSMLRAVASSALSTRVLRGPVHPKLETAPGGSCGSVWYSRPHKYWGQKCSW